MSPIREVRGLARHSGITLAGIGVASLAWGVASLMFPERSGILGAGNVIFIMAAVLYMVIRGQRYVTQAAAAR